MPPPHRGMPGAAGAHLALALGSSPWAPPQSKGPAQLLHPPAADPSLLQRSTHPYQKGLLPAEGVFRDHGMMIFNICK